MIKYSMTRDTSQPETIPKIGNHIQSEKDIRGLYSKEFTQYFRGLFLPLSRVLMKAGVTPNTVTFFSLIFGAFTGILFALNYLWTGLAFGLAMSFADIVDGQLAKEFGDATKFGSILDSTLDRYNEFFVFTGLAFRYYFLGRPLWITGCVLALYGSLMILAFRYYFLGRPLWITGCVLALYGSLMISYVKARAETEGIECKVGRLQRPERLTILGVGVLFRSLGIDIAITFLAVFSQITILYRIQHVYRQSRKQTL